MENFSVALVIEVLGRPSEHVSGALNSLIEKLSKEKEVTLKEKTVHDPIKVESSDDLFTAFAELELEITSLSTYFYLIFAYMPSHIELISPEKITLQNSELNELANALTQRLHTYDALAKNSLVEREYFLKKIKEISPETFDKLVQVVEKEVKEKQSKESSSQQK